MLFTLSLLIAGCKPFNVKPEVRVASEVTPKPAESDGLRVEATVVLDEDHLVDTFDANLIMAGILPVKVTVENLGAEPRDLSKLQFELSAQGRGKFKDVPPKKAFRRLVRFYEITAYSKFGYKESKSDFDTHALDRGALDAYRIAEGLIFFRVPDSIARGAGLTLIVKGLESRGPSGKKKEIKLS